MISSTSSCPGTPPPLADRAPQQLQDQVGLTLENAIPGIRANTLIHAIDVLLGGRDNYSIVGSTSMHLHALKHPNRTCSLPLPHDIDLVACEQRVSVMGRIKNETLEKCGLKRDEKFAHVFHMARDGQPDLKIDIVSSKTPGFGKYRSSSVAIHGLNVGRITDTLNDYRARVSDPEFIKQCGGIEQARAKIEPWLKYFDQFREANSADTPESMGGERTRRHLLSSSEPSRDSDSANVRRTLRF